MVVISLVWERRQLHLSRREVTLPAVFYAWNVYSIIGVVVCRVPYILNVWEKSAQMSENSLLHGHAVFVWLCVYGIFYLFVRMYKRGRSYGYGPVVAAKRARVYGGPGRPKQSGTTRYRQFNTRASRGPSTRGSILSQIKSLQNVVKKLSPEMKYKTVDTSASNIPSTGTVVSLNNIPQDDTMSGRTGNAIVVNKISLTGYFQRNSTDFGADAFYRIAIVCDKEQVNNTSPTAAQIFDVPAIPTDGLALSSNLERFRMLWLSPVYDAWRMRLDSDLLAASTPTQATNFAHTWTGSIRVLFSGTGAEVQKNGLYVVFLSNIAVGDVASTCRVGYTDV